MSTKIVQGKLTSHQPHLRLHPQSHPHPHPHLYPLLHLHLHPHCHLHPHLHLHLHPHLHSISPITNILIPHLRYLLLYNEDEGAFVVEVVSRSATWFIILSQLVPISLMVTTEVVRVIQVGAHLHLHLHSHPHPHPLPIGRSH